MTILPITYNTTSKSISTDNTQLETEITQLNSLYSSFISLNSDIPPPPSPTSFTKELSLEIKKLHETGQGLLRQNRFNEAFTAFTRGLELAKSRSSFEPFQGSLPEFLVCLMGRCDSSMAMKNYQMALQDSEVLILLGATIPDNHLRHGTAQLHCGLIREAVASFQRGISIKGDHPLLRGAFARATVLLQLENGDL